MGSRMRWKAFIGLRYVLDLAVGFAVNFLLTELAFRLVFMMPPESGFFAVVKTCWV